MPRSSLPSLAAKAAIFLIGFVLTSALADAQQSQLDYNAYYSFPLSIGVEYQSLSPFSLFEGAPYTAFDLSANVRWPIPALPILQPTLKGGLMQFDSQSLADALRWDHSYWYAETGASYANRFSKGFEIGAEILGGVAYSVFPNLVPEVGPVGALNFLFEAGATLALNPSYNLSIGIHPRVRYLLFDTEMAAVLARSPEEEPNGLIFSIGFALHYRFGTDPDAPTAAIRSIRFDDVKVPPLFAAMQSYYVKHPAGKAKITNTEKHSLTDVQVSFFQKDYMDSPTPAAAVSELKAGESREIELFASFNREVFTTEGITPLTAEVIVSYKSRDRTAEQRQPVSYDLHDKTAITWDDDRKVAAFITPSDSALKNYTSFIRQVCKEETLPGYSGEVQLGMQVFEALGVMGTLYQADPALPFTQVQENPMVVDSISLPRDTLKRITGDCDDLTVLYASLLETAGVQTAFITVPGHIYAAFSTRIPSQDYRKIHPERGMTVTLEGELWVPVEITLIGRTDFLEAWRKGVEQWSALDASPDKRGFFPTRKAQELYRPVGLKESDMGLQYGSKDAILAGFRRDRDKLVERTVRDLSQAAQQSGKKEDYNKLGIAYAQFLQYPSAEQAFGKALSIDPAYVSAQNNLGNLLFLRKQYQQALDAYRAAFDRLGKKEQTGGSAAVRLLINISRAYYQMERLAEAKDFYARAAAMDAESVKEYSYLAERAASEGRAAVNRDPGNEVVFLEE
jgi:hypothetical protein